MGRFTPEIHEAEALRERVGEGPVVMVNLLKFKQPGGLEAFSRYGAVTAPLFQEAGAEVIYSGSGGPVLAGGVEWDLVLLVRFENIERFIKMVTDPRYQNDARPHRDTGLDDAIWMASTPHT